MTKLIAALIIVAVLYGGWKLFFYWESVKNEESDAKKQAAATAVTSESLNGVPQGLQQSLQKAQQQGATALGNWLKTYDRVIQDPRKAWIQLDYCDLIARKDPAEAKRIFADVKNRTPPASPVYSRIKALEKIYE